MQNMASSIISRVIETSCCVSGQNEEALHNSHNKDQGVSHSVFSEVRVNYFRENCVHALPPHEISWLLYPAGSLLSQDLISDVLVIHRLQDLFYEGKSSGVGLVDPWLLPLEMCYWDGCRRLLTHNLSLNGAFCSWHHVTRGDVKAFR